MLALFFFLGEEPPPVWDVSRPEPAHQHYLQNPADPAGCTADMTNLLNEARAYLNRTGGRLVLSFPAGEFHFTGDTNSGGTAGIPVEDFKKGELIIRGAGDKETSLFLHALHRPGIWVRRSSNVTIENFHLTQDGYYSSQFDVISVTATNAHLRLHDGFPSPEYLRGLGTRWNGQEMTLIPFRYDTNGIPQRDPSDNKRLLFQITGDYTNTPFTDLGGGEWLIKFREISNPQVPGWGAGDMVALKIRTGQNTLRFLESNDCIARDLLITRFCGNPIRSFHNCNRLLIERVHVARPIGGVGGRIPYFSGSDGAIQLVSGAAGPTVRDCVIECTADDGIGIFSSTNGITSGILVERNTVYDGQARGILISQSINGICRSNTLIRCNSPSIYIYNTRDGFQDDNIHAENWDIYGNTFVDSLINPVFGFGSYPGIPAGLHKNISFHHNTFIGSSRNNHLILVEQTESVNISSNIIKSFNSELDYIPLTSGNSLIYVAAGESVTGTGNVCEDPTDRLIWRKRRLADTVDVEWSGAVIPLTNVSSTVIYSNDFSGAAGSSISAAASVGSNLIHEVIQVELNGSGSLISTGTIAGMTLRVKLSDTSLTNEEVRLIWTMRAITSGSWIGVGFSGELTNKLNEAAANSGPWVLVTTNSISLRGGTALVDGSSHQRFANALSAGDELSFELVYYTTRQTADLWLNGVMIADGVPIVHINQHGAPAPAALRYLQIQIWTDPGDTGRLDSIAVETRPANDI